MVPVSLALYFPVLVKGVSGAPEAGSQMVKESLADYHCQFLVVEFSACKY